MRRLIAAAANPVRLVCGEFDHMVTIDQLRQFDPGAVVIAGSGHNAHIESPSALAALITPSHDPTTH
jgi:pimeloyl-ACP methyl ester carboxylesterase